MTSYVQDGGHDVISIRKVPLSSECTRSVCRAHTQPRPTVHNTSTAAYMYDRLLA